MSAAWWNAFCQQKPQWCLYIFHIVNFLLWSSCQGDKFVQHGKINARSQQAEVWVPCAFLFQQVLDWALQRSTCGLQQVSALLLYVYPPPPLTLFCFIFLSFVHTGVKAPWEHWFLESSSLPLTNSSLDSVVNLCCRLPLFLHTLTFCSIVLVI